jgi:ATP-dependent Clp protease ATP-binding subunit ClpA/CheY-like chemotaxis protein
MDETSERNLTPDLVGILGRKIVGQSGAIERIVPYVQMYQAGLTPEGRPIAVFLLLGPTGTGKTRTVEVLAEALHGSAQRYVRVDCGEFQLEHEVAKLIGSPPGYLGHRETIPLLSAQKLTEATTPESDISLVLFDEIEKAAPSLSRLLLGVLDKGRLTLGDNSVVNFEKSLIFLTSNLGARDMMRELNPAFGFEVATEVKREVGDVASKLESIALAAVRKKFSPEFVNRIDAVITYQPLSQEAVKHILDHQIEELQNHVNRRLGPRGFPIDVKDSAKEFLLSQGISTEYGARELKRTVHRHLTQPLATMVAEDRIQPGAQVTVSLDEAAGKLRIEAEAGAPRQRASESLSVLIVDDNKDLLGLLKMAMRGQKWEIEGASTAEEALQIAEHRHIDVALVDYLLPDLDGLALGKRLKERLPGIEVILMSGGDLSAAEEEARAGHAFAFVQKPFLVDDVIALIRRRVLRPQDPETSKTAGSS